MIKISYTYEDFEKEAKGAGLFGEFSAADLTLAKIFPEAGQQILSYKRQYHAASTDEERKAANLKANEVRSFYGSYTASGSGQGFFADASKSKYSGAVDEAYKALGDYGGFSFDGEAPRYSGSYDAEIRALLEGIKNREPFVYDKEDDPSYSAYAKQYRREGERASADALGKASAATGGIPSSYAATAASQAGDYYASKLGDKLPELYKAAYERYMDEYDSLLKQLGAVEGQQEFEYGQYLDSLKQYNTERGLALEESESGLDALIKRLEATAGLSREDIETRIALAKLAASVGDTSFLEALGITPEEAGVSTGKKSGGAKKSSGSKAGASALSAAEMAQKIDALISAAFAGAGQSVMSDTEAVMKTVEEIAKKELDRARHSGEIDEAAYLELLGRYGLG